MTKEEQKIADWRLTLNIAYNAGYEYGMNDRRKGKWLDEKNIPDYRQHKNEYRERASKAGYKAAYKKESLSDFGWQGPEYDERERFVTTLLKEMGLLWIFDPEN